jgi:hypothetical protein
MGQQFGMFLFPCSKSGNAVAGGQILPMQLHCPNFAYGVATSKNHATQST